ncbi:hypothetical protein ABTL82_19515, partial [Acinetobacter baumannii]
IACVISYLFSGHSGIYRSQRVGHGKYRSLPEEMKLGEVSAWRKRTRAYETSGNQDKTDQ